MERRELTEAQHAALATRRADQDRTLAAMHALETALGAAAPGRERSWREDVLSALEVLETATGEEQSNAAQPDSLLSDIGRTQPRLRNRVRGLRVHYAQLRDNIRSLCDELDHADESLPDFADLRQRMTWLLNALRHQRARESDLIYEAYYEAFQSDLGEPERPDRTCPDGR
jgi:hypothetical protein